MDFIASVEQLFGRDVMPGKRGPKPKGAKGDCAIWTLPARLAGLRALLAHPGLGAKKPNLSVLSRLGVASVRCVRRISVGKCFNVGSAV